MDFEFSSKQMQLREAILNRRGERVATLRRKALTKRNSAARA